MSVSHASGTIVTFVYQEEEDTIPGTDPPDGEPAPLTVCPGSLGAADVIAACLAAMADQALACWPHWYGGEYFVESPSRSIDDRLHSFLAALDLCRRDRNIEPAWLKRAVNLVIAARPPLVSGIPGELQARQLALALQKQIGAIALKITPEAPTERDGAGFPKAVEWLARETGVDIRVLLPRALADNPAFAPLLYNARTWHAGAVNSRNSPIDSKAEPARPPDAIPAPPPAPRIPDENAPETERIIGKPHPRSKGEQLLEQWLAKDAELAGMFGHNQVVVTACGRRFIVDLLWAAGRVVVEVDGYYYHGNSMEFATDRDRDYRLLISGYRVLRLTHEEVVRDTGLAIEKIRDVVNFVQNSGSEATR